MFNGFRILNSNYIYLFLNNNYEFASDINTKQKKEKKTPKNQHCLSEKKVKETNGQSVLQLEIISWHPTKAITDLII